jgi:hypothetical protein
VFVKELLRPRLYRNQQESAENQQETCRETATPARRRNFYSFNDLTPELVPKPGWFWNKLLEKPVKSD